MRTFARNGVPPRFDLRGALAGIGLALALAPAAPALAQVCSYPQLTDDTPQAFTGTPTYTRFAQNAGRWAAVAVKSGGTADWNIGLSTNSAPFASCVTFPVVASQQPTGVDFVLGDFAAEGTGTYYAPIARSSGTGNATVEWDSGARTAVPGANYYTGQNPSSLIDCWNVDLVAGTSYKIWLWSDVPGDYHLYAFRRGATNSWRSKSDALVEVVSSLTGPPILSATTTDRYALVVVNTTGTLSPYEFVIQPCVDPADLAPHVSLPVPIGLGRPETPFQFEVGATGFPTIAARTAAPGDNFDLTIAQRTGPGFYPCEGLYQSGSGDYGPRVDLIVGDRVSGAVASGGTYWAGVVQGGIHAADGRVEYSPGTDLCTVDGATQYVVGGNDLVARTFRTDLVAGTTYRIHVAKCGPATGRLLVFRPFDTGNPIGNGWSSANNGHPPVASVNVLGVNDFTFTPTVSGAHALVLTNETAENVCFELGVSTCRPRLEMPDGVSVGIYANPILAYDGEAYGTLHGRFGWSAVAVRPHAVSPREDWVVEAWDAPSGGGGAPPFGCLSGLLGASTDDGTGSRVDFLARYDIPVPPLQEWVETVHVYPAAHASPGGGAAAEFEQWNNTLPLGTLINLFPTTPFDLIEVWNVELVAGQSYAVHFAPVGFEGELFVMRSTRTDFTGCPSDCPPEYQPLGGTGQVLRTATPTVFMAPETGVYGLIVVNQNGGTGHFSLAVDATLVGVAPGDGTPAVTRFRAAAPNPVGRAGTQFAFDLAAESSVGFEVVNIAGRVIAHLPERTYPAGAGLAAWPGRGDDGAPVAPGVYFVRMRVDGALAGRGGKLIVL